MSLTRYLQTINEINPQRIYVENVRSFLKVPTFAAKLLCEMAVVDHVFTKKYAIICPNNNCGRTIKSFDSLSQIPEKISCEICEFAEKEKYVFKTKDLRIMEFYQLVKNVILES